MKQTADRRMWQIRDASVGCVQAWDDEGACLFYSARSGDTHKLDALAVELYYLLRDQPATEDEILRSLRDAYHPGNELAAMQQLRIHLAQYTKIGLLRELPA
ncbi:MAG: HPr-rel-A system PqqD family peptide chaperone [Rhodoferax sp.]|nr:HPr-rel-A system PqqD family peptide chaperone [Rhodoferax sp.]